jgi:hypothetical protein
MAHRNREKETPQLIGHIQTLPLAPRQRARNLTGASASAAAAAATATTTKKKQEEVDY